MQKRDKLYDKYPPRLQVLISQTTGEFNSGVAKYGVIYGDNQIAYYTNHACHAGLEFGRRWLRHFNDVPYSNGFSIEQNEKLHYVWSSIRKPIKDDDWSDKDKSFIDYLVNRSIYHHAFVSKSVNKIIEDRCLLLRTDVYNNYLAAACIASRALWEKRHILNSWYNMVENGIDERVAHMLAHCINDKLIVSISEGHCCFSGRYSVDDLKKMYKADELAFNGPLYRGYPKYNNIHRLSYRLSMNNIPWDQYDKGRAEEVYSFTKAVNSLFLRNQRNVRSTTMKALKQIEKEVINA